MKLSIIIVSYNTKSLLRNCLKTVFDNILLDKEIFVIDNASYDNTCGMVLEEFPKVRLIANLQNQGYNFANNQALKKAIGNYILLLNPDTMVTKEAIEKMIDFMDKHPEVGICGPQIINLEGKPDLSAYPLPNLRDAIEEGIITYNFPMTPLTSRLVYRRKYLSATLREETIPVGWVSGAALMIRKELLALIGDKDENLFAYAEEADWGIKTKRLGYKTFYFPKSQVIHIGSASSDQNWVLKCDRVRSSYKERLYFTKKHFSPLAYYFLRFYLFVEIWTKILIRTFFTWEEPKRLEYLKAYEKSLEYLY